MRLAAAVALLTLATSVLAQSHTYMITKGGTNVAEFHAEDTYDSFDGRTSDVTGMIVADPSRPSAASVQININVQSLETGVALRNREMRGRYLETAKWPVATFKSIAVTAPPTISPNQPADVSVTGDLTLHGTTRRMTIPVRVVLIPDGRVHATANFKVHMPDFGIDVPHNVLVTVNDDVPVRLDVWAK